jgi:hypothetical protein
MLRAAHKTTFHHTTQLGSKKNPCGICVFRHVDVYA